MTENHKNITNLSQRLKRAKLAAGKPAESGLKARIDAAAHAVAEEKTA